MMAHHTYEPYKKEINMSLNRSTEKTPLLPPDSILEIAEESDSTPPSFFSSATAFFKRHLPSNMKEKLVNACPAFVEATINVGFALLTYNFIPVEKNKWLSTFVPASVTTFLNSVIRAKTQDFKQGQTETTQKHLDHASRTIRGLMFTCNYINTANLLIHEGGHWLTAKAAFKNNPYITVNPTEYIFNTAVTYYQPQTLTALGNYLGNNASKILVTANGPITQMLSGYLNLIVAQTLPDRYSDIKTYLRLMTVGNVILQLQYSLSECTKTNDFCNLEKDGIPSWVMVTGIVVSTLGLQLLLSCVSNRKQICNKNNIEEELSEEKYKRVKL